MEQIGRIQIVGHVAQNDYAQLATFAERRGLVHESSGRPNVSAALREVIRAGLAALEAGDGKTEVRHDDEN